MNVYDQWLDEKLKLPLLVANSYDSSAPVIGPFSHQQKPEKVQNTEELLMEFDYVYENVELTHLTPPQTPPQEAHFVGQSESQRELLLPVSVEQIQSQQQHETNEYYGYGAPMNGLLVNSAQTINQPQQQQGTEEYQIADSFGFQPVDEVENIARNLELVDEIVRSRSKDLPDCNDDDDSCSFSEDGSVSSSCPMSDSSSSYCGSAYSRDQDDEWSPSSGKKSLKVSGGGVTKKRTRPYGRGVEDKKSRKKEQNKNAATRYRQKKKAEIEEVLIEERKLRDKNEELKGKSADIGREIRYLKSLMREVFKVKGLI
ncbi:activating transcription factor of chaperone isoform X2 [Malaya genurostris]|uniref:activating transcription factor of chaperone isoform X2 n=1 Tax=Malaya genurostris TaxID=325434 RepID=UPI0026F3DC36|nr:activating transcription factor of chaperone isoform X2 [Malaya genurostris]